MTKDIDVAEVWLWGKQIGSVAIPRGEPYAYFEYHPDFIATGIQISPLKMPLNHAVYSFPELNPKSFYGLSGLLADSLPDKFGNAVLDAWLASQGRDLDSLSPVERLCYQGKRGMGALEFVPSYGPNATSDQKIRVDALVDLANQILSYRSQVDGNFKNEPLKKSSLLGILRVGSSAGGARAKAVIAWNPKTNEVRSGQIKTKEGFEHWLIKFDGISNNKDKESLSDPQGYGLTEFAYYKMAIDCGITMSECRLMRENGRSHFMTRRFDRQSNGEKIHMQTLAAIAHYDFNHAGKYSYEQAFNTLKDLHIPFDSAVELFRRMVFNIIGRNQDDHVKNIAFLMNQEGEWSLAPAYDLTYNYQKSGDWTSLHQMTLHGKRDDFHLDDFLSCAKLADIKPKQAKEIIERTRNVVAKWRDYADQEGVPAIRRDKIYKNLRLDPF